MKIVNCYFKQELEMPLLDTILAESLQWYG